ncbi:DNRLRE domain-containing protein [Gottfriedia sp. NPDC057991]|uniref:DNRLRE domain-containing protein n=1 Tax=Gottfriedia sp. NPDC057991 TaxID=3346298 RepID=UPI0036DC6EA9
MSKSSKFVQKLLVILTVFCLIVPLVPKQFIMHAMGEEKNVVKKVEKNTKEKVKIKKVRELSDKRTRNTKTWRNSDLSETIEVYPSPIYYQEDGKKQWKKIDNNLTEKINDGLEKGKFKYQNKANKYKAYFGSNGNKEIFKMKQGKNWLSYSIDNASSTSVAKSKKDRVTYNDILVNTDVKYYLRSEGIKEDVIFHEEPTFDSIKYNLKTNLEVRQIEKDIEFFDSKTNQVVWSFIPPYLIDAEDRESYNVNYQILKDKENVVIELKLDKEFLKSKKTKYPVILDPTLTVGGATSNTSDAYVGEAYNNVNYGSASELRTGYAPDVNSHRTYIKFGTSLPSLNGGILTGANIKLYKYYEPASVDTNIYIHRAYSAWTSSTIKWNNQPQYGGSYAYKTFAKGAANGWYSWAVGNLANYWYDNPANYHGIVMVANNENTTGSYRKFYSSDYSSGAYSPKLEITYSPKPAAPTATPYSNKNGTGYVNLSWPSIAGATGYKVLIFNGRSYEEFDVGNVTSWTTKGKKIWPTKAQIDAGQYGLRKNGDGRELPENPNDLYKR